MKTQTNDNTSSGLSKYLLRGLLALLGFLGYNYFGGNGGGLFTTQDIPDSPQFICTDEYVVQEYEIIVVPTNAGPTNGGPSGGGGISALGTKVYAQAGGSYGDLKDRSTCEDQLGLYRDVNKKICRCNIKLTCDGGDFDDSTPWSPTLSSDITTPDMEDGYIQGDTITVGFHPIMSNGLRWDRLDEIAALSPFGTQDPGFTSILCNNPADEEVDVAEMCDITVADKNLWTCDGDSSSATCNSDAECQWNQYVCSDGSFDDDGVCVVYKTTSEGNEVIDGETVCMGSMPSNSFCMTSDDQYECSTLGGWNLVPGGDCVFGDNGDLDYNANGGAYAGDVTVCVPSGSIPNSEQCQPDYVFRCQDDNEDGIAEWMQDAGTCSVDSSIVDGYNNRDGDEDSYELGDLVCISHGTSPASNNCAQNNCYECTDSGWDAKTGKSAPCGSITYEGSTSYETNDTVCGDPANAPAANTCNGNTGNSYICNDNGNWSQTDAACNGVYNPGQGYVSPNIVCSTSVPSNNTCDGDTKIDGACGVGNAVPSSPDSCEQGTYSNDNGVDCGMRTWICQGLNGGSDSVECQVDLGVCVQYDCPALSANYGDACNDFDADTVSDEIQNDCSCAGSVPTCDNGSAPQTPGTSCDDGNPSTVGEIIQNDGCTCAGGSNQITCYSCNGADCDSQVVNGSTCPAGTYTSSNCNNMCDTIVVGSAGCTNPDACNYNPAATTDNGTCNVPGECEVCDGQNVVPDSTDTDGDTVADCKDLCEGHDDYIDTDFDSIPNGCDNCVDVYNDGQEDSDNDGQGDACETTVVTCTDAEANNTGEEGSCTYNGCLNNTCIDSLTSPSGDSCNSNSDCVDPVIPVCDGSLSAMATAESSCDMGDGMIKIDLSNVAPGASIVVKDANGNIVDTATHFNTQSAHGLAAGGHNHQTMANCGASTNCEGYSIYLAHEIPFDTQVRCLNPQTGEVYVTEDVAQSATDVTISGSRSTAPAAGTSVLCQVMRENTAGDMIWRDMPGGTKSFAAGCSGDPVKVNGACGSTLGQCVAGMANNVNDTECSQDDTWTCEGKNGGDSASCSASEVCATCSDDNVDTLIAYFGPLYGIANAGPDDLGTICNYSQHTVNNDSSVQSTYDLLSVCCDNAPMPMDGMCGSSFGTCMVGNVSDKNNTACGTADTWTCEGSNGGVDNTCVNPDVCTPTNASCGSVFGTCASGTPTQMNNTACGTADTWRCESSNGGNSSTCSVTDHCDPDPTCTEQSTSETQTYMYLIPGTYTVEVSYTSTTCKNCTESTTVVVSPAPCDDTYDLALKKTLLPGASSVYQPGSPVTFNITVVNQGNVDASGIVVTDYIPAGLTFDSSLLASTVAGNTVSFTVPGTLAAGDSTTFAVNFMIDSDFTGTSIANYAEISADDGDDCDSTADANDSNDGQVIDNNIGQGCDEGGDEDDHDVEEITITQPDVEICDGQDNDGDGEIDEGFEDMMPGKTCDDGDDMTNNDVYNNVCVCVGETSDPEYDLALVKDLADGQSRTVAQGDVVTFTVTVTNQGDITANTYELVDHLPDGLTLNDADWTDAGNNNATIVLNTVLAPGAFTTVDITVTVDEGVEGELVNVVEILADDGDDVDSSPNNDDGDQSEDEEDPEPLTVINLEVCDGKDNDGDGKVDEGYEDTTPGELCDDGNASTVGDIYNDSCVCVGIVPGGSGGGGNNHCGDGVQRAGEECDDGNYENGDGCSSNCKITGVCGDGIMNTEAEQCDDGNTEDMDGCSATCITEVYLTCGDGAVNQEREQCDDGNTSSDDGCSATCQIEDDEIIDLILNLKPDPVLQMPERIITPLILPKTGADIS